METSPEPTIVTSDKAEKARNRSAAYPAVDLEQAIQAATELNKNLGEGPYSRLAAAEALGYTGVSGTSASKIASLVHFNLLNRQGNTYSLSELSKKILSPVSDQERVEAVVAAASSPKLYASLIADHSGRSLPTMLENLLFRNYKISSTVAKEVAKNFRKSLELAGLLTNGVVKNLNDLEPKPQTRDVTEKITGENLESSIKETLSGPYQTIMLPSGVRVQFPTELAYQLALGSFAKDLEALNETVVGITRPSENSRKEDFSEVENDKS